MLTPDRLRRAVVLGAMALFVATAYATVRVTATMAGGGDPGIGVWLAVTALVAALAPAARRRAEHVADRLAYGPDGDPHAAMTRFVQRISDTLAVDEVLPDLARTASRVAHSPGTEVRLWLADGGEWRQTWPPGRDDVHTRFSLELQRGANPVGQLGVEVAEDQLSPADRELLDRLAGPAGLALANVRLTYELRDRLRQATELAEQVHRSRERLIGARAVQRRRFAADVHERVEGHLAIVAESLAHLARSGPDAGDEAPPDRGAPDREAPPDRGAPDRLERARTEALAALEALRELASGLYPPALADGGLVDALDHHIDVLAAPVTLDSAVDDTGLAPAVRAAAYFCAVGLVDDLARHGPVEVRLSLDEQTTAAGTGGHDRLRLRVRACGRPTSDTEQIVRDRVDAFGGDLAVDGPPAATVVTAALPLRVPSEGAVPAGAGWRR
ncbi:sensor histidine kinase [Krasilnikovia sp. M28-CT-15]|uniref:sensor histidine kinase n=1 Tax=Krasilnikovia sp. M28-CT-15 TaxID=3373540 RepID=UPI00399C8AF5